MKQITLFLVSLFFMILTVNSQTVNLTKNPYAEVKWSTVNQYKANFHTHTTNSDGNQSPIEVVEEYGSKGYDILSITDHNVTTWPWPENAYNMLAIKGNEYSNSHHMNAMLSFDNSNSTLESGIPDVQNSGGISQINHPGRYYTPADWSWYIPWFQNYSTCGILEVFNQGDRYPDDRKLWDNINENLFEKTGELVWGSSNDDKHSTSHLYSNFNFILMPELTQESWEEAMKKGAFYFCYESGRSGDAKVPIITNIVDDSNTKTIAISGTGIDSIQWVGVGTSVVTTGLTFDYSAYTGQPFIRAILYGPNGNSYTQPFGFETDAPNNNAPTCAITSPGNETHYSAPPRIIIEATASDSDGSITSVEFSVNGSSVGKVYSAPYSIVYSIPENGDYSITVTAKDNLGSKTTSSTVDITVGNGISTSARINSTLNDVEEEVNDGSIDDTSSDIELANDGSDNQIIGLRFTGLDIPQGANIISANIQFTTDETNTGECNLTIKGENTGNSAEFSTTKNVVSSRTTTSASVAWSPADWTLVGEADSEQRSPDISSIIQEIIDINGYTSSSAISIIISGSGERTAESYNGSPSNAPLLSVNYITEGESPSNFAPEITIATPSNGDTFVNSTSVNLTADASDSDGTITKVEFFVDGVSVGVVSSAPYEQNWTIGNDTYNIYAIATDDKGAATTSSTVTIKGVVSYPTVSISYPLNHASFTPGTNITVSADAADVDGTISSVQFFQDEISIGTVTSEPYSINFIVSEGIHSLSAMATDNDGLTSTFNAVSVTVYDDNVQTISIPVANGDDDVEERENDGEIYLSSSDLEFCYDSWNDQFHQTVGLRFQNVDIPQGASIENAYIQFTSKTTEDGEISLNIEGDDANNSSAFSGIYDVSSRTKTTANVTWNPPAWTAGESSDNERTSDLSTIVQEIVSRGEWNRNNAMSFIITNDGTDQDKRTAKSTDNNYPPQLHIYYSIGFSLGTHNLDATEFGFDVDPNPVSNGIINLEIRSEDPHCQVLIFDTNGTIVISREVLSDKTKINVSDFVKGIYFVKVISTNRALTQKIIIE